MDHLKDCPFCYEDDVLVGACDNGRSERSASRIIGYSAMCQNCGSRGPIAAITELSTDADRYAAVERAAALWNKEAPA